MAEVGSAYVSILPSAKGFGSKLSKQVEPDTKKAGNSIGKKLAAGFAIAGGASAAFGFLKGAVNDASDLSESASKVGVVFGKQSGQIMRASKTSATAMGLTKSAYLDATGTLGNLLVSLDIAPKKAAGMSQQMVKLAGDLASFNNTSPEEALDALKSGLTGETEPLKRFGVNMNDATLKATALKMGLIDSTKEALTPQTKALAAQKLIMEQTGTAQGDFARTSDGLANQQRILAAQFGNVKATIGQALLPIITDLASSLNSKVLPAVKTFIDQMKSGEGAGGKFADTMQSVFETGKNVVTALTPMAKAVVSLVGGFAKLPGPVKSFAFELGLAALVFPKIRGALGGLPTALTSPIQSARNFGNEMRNVETRAAAVGRVMNGLKNVAGIGGMALMADGARRSSGALKELETVGGAALAGFAVGGPIGAAVAGGGTALFRLGRAAVRAGSDVEGSKAGIGSIVGTLNRVSGAATQATTDLTFNTITKQGGFTAFNKIKSAYSGLAITERDLVQASMGNVGAQKRVTAALNTATSSVKKSAAGDSSKYKAVQDVMKATQAVNKVIGVNSSQNKKATATERAHFRATATTAQLLKRGMAPAATTAANAVGNLGRKSQRSAKDVHGVGNEIKKVPSKKNVDLNVDTHGSESKVRTLREQMQALQDRTLHIRTITDKPHSPLPGNALGTNDWRGGPTWVGERGPEIVNLPRHAQVIPNDKITSGGAGGVMRVLVMNPGDIATATDGRAARQVVAYSGVSREAARSRR